MRGLLAQVALDLIAQVIEINRYFAEAGLVKSPEVSVPARAEAQRATASAGNTMSGGKRGIFLSPPRVELGVGIRDGLGGVERRAAPRRAGCVVGSPSTSTKKPMGVSSRATTLPLAVPLLPPLVVTEARLEAEAGENRLGLPPGRRPRSRAPRAPWRRPGSAPAPCRSGSRGPRPGAGGPSGRCRRAGARRRRRARSIPSWVAARSVAPDCASLSRTADRARDRNLDLDLLARARRPRRRHGSRRRAISWAFFPSTRPR